MRKKKRQKQLKEARRESENPPLNDLTLRENQYNR
jgi:hypothetical protein